MRGPLRRAAHRIGDTLPPEAATGRLLRRLYRRLTPELQRPHFPIVLEAFAKSRDDICFIQIGANDGSWGDPLRPFVLPRRWAGLVVEPQPEVFDRLRARYRRQQRVAPVCAAIAPEDGTRPLYYLAPSNEPDLPPWYDQLASFDRDHLLKHRRYLADIESRIRCRDVTCLRFDTLLAENGVHHFDLLHVDAEGYDQEILRLADLDRHRPAIVLFEHRHMSDADFVQCQTMLQTAGYRLFRDSDDTLCIHTDALEVPDPRLRRAWQRLPDSGKLEPA